MMCLLCVITEATGSNVLVIVLCKEQSSGLVRSYPQDLEGNQWEELKESTVSFGECYAAFLMHLLSSTTFCKLCPFYYFQGIFTHIRLKKTQGLIFL